MNDEEPGPAAASGSEQAGLGRAAAISCSMTGCFQVKFSVSRHGRFTATVRAAQSADPTLPRVTPHDLRHTAASLAVPAGAHAKALRRLLGHASAAMALDVYADLFDDDLDAVASARSQARLAATGAVS